MTDNADTTTDKRSSTRQEITPNIVSNELRKFYENHGIDVDCLVEVNDEAPAASRFIRLNPRFDRNETLLLLKNELASNNCGNKSNSSAEPLPVPWLNDESLGFYALPGNFRLAQSPCYNQGRIYGMDISSGSSVAALLSTKYDKIKNDHPLTLPATATRNKKDDSMEPFRILDLCCAPGLKLCAIADWLSCNTTNILPERQQQHESPTTSDLSSVVVGIDVSESRIATCKRILHKYHVHPETSGKGQKETDHKDASNNQQIQGNDVTKNKVRIRLYCCDGTTFDRPLSRPTNQQGLANLVFDSMAAMEEKAVTGKRKRMNKSARARERKRLKSLAGEDFAVVDTQDEDEDESLSQKDAQDHGKKNESETSTDNKSTINSNWKAKQFDRVLVDAECSTDGSLKHIQKQIMRNNENGSHNSDNVSAKGVASKLTDEAQLSALVQLQKKLAAAGFRLLKPGGVMVYSTCSLSHQQNEQVVEWLLEKFAQTAFVIPVGFPMHNNDEGLVTEGEFGVRFHPCLPATKTITSKANESAEKDPTISHRQVFFGGGFFLSKIGKRF